MDTDKTIITCKRNFNHPVEAVFQCFINPNQVKEWFGPREFRIGKVFLYPVTGGELSIEMITPKGDSLWVKGIYREIIPHEKISYSFKYEPDLPNLGETLVTIYFKYKAEKTEVTLVHTIYKPIDPVGRAKGWETGFDKMEALLGNNTNHS